jgi:hypothetical protein
MSRSILALGQLIGEVVTKGGTTCVMTFDEFATLVTQVGAMPEDAQILNDLGVFGYMLGITIFDSEIWSANPLTFKAVTDPAYR